MRVIMADGNDDGDEVSLKVARRYLSEFGHEVSIAGNRLEAIATLRRGQPSVVVPERDLRLRSSYGIRARMQKVPRRSEIRLMLTSNDTMPIESNFVAGPPVIARLSKPDRLRDSPRPLPAYSLNGTTGLLSGAAPGGRP